MTEQDYAARVPTVCKCGGAKDYHRPEDRRDHQYEPRWEPDSWREGYERARAERAGAARGSAGRRG